MEEKNNKSEKGISVQIEIPEGIQVEIKEGKFTAKGKKGEVSKNLDVPLIDIKKKDNKIILSNKKLTRKTKRFIGTYEAHIKNILKGADHGYTYKLKICSGHFPMNVSVNNGEIIIKNFIGEKFPRILKIKKGVDIRVEGDVITVESCDKELAGQVAADIEKITKRSNFDTRIFQDGIFIIEKAGKDIK